MTTSYSVIGLGKLGASMVAGIAHRGCNVIGVDVIPRSVELVNVGRAPVQETNLDEMLSANRARIRATLDYREAVLNSDVTFVVVPTPSEATGAFSLKYAAAAFREIGCALAEKNSYHLVVMTSTVLPGSTRYGLLPVVEQASGKKCGPDFGLCYSPEFIALGSVIHDFLNPDFLLVGEFDARSGERLEQVYAEIMENGAPCQRMSIENAELAKIALNTYVTTKITFANMLADLCERLPGGDVDVVTNAIGLDTRIGRKYLKGALGYGGPCFPRDNVALNYMARQLDTRAYIAETTDWYNRSLPDWLMTRLDHALRASSTVGVLGLTYKPYSHVTEESHGILLAKALIQAGKRVIAFDPLVSETAREELPPGVTVCASLRECLTEADTVLITTPDPIFKSLKADDFNLDQIAVTVVDFWRILDRSIIQHPKIKYVAVGRSVDDAANAARLAQLWTGRAME
jgi:UDPglucose 6-dehydrogenase